MEGRPVTSIRKAARKPMHPKRVEYPDAKCPDHTKKDYRLLVKAAWAAGWWCVKRRKYIFIYPIDSTQDIVKVPMTPSSQRTLENLKSALKGAGLDL